MSMHHDEKLVTTEIVANCLDETLFNYEKLHVDYFILFFYPKDNTPGCTVECIDFSNSLGEFEKMCLQVFGISKDSVKTHNNFIKKHDLKVSLLIDKDRQTAKNFAVIKENMFGKKVLAQKDQPFNIKRWFASKIMERCWY